MTLKNGSTKSPGIPKISRAPWSLRPCSSEVASAGMTRLCASQTRMQTGRQPTDRPSFEILSLSACAALEPFVRFPSRDLKRRAAGACAGDLAVNPDADPRVAEGLASSAAGSASGRSPQPRFPDHEREDRDHAGKRRPAEPEPDAEEREVAGRKRGALSCGI